MAYQIRYTDMTVIKDMKTTGKPSMKWIAALCALLFLSLLLRLKPVQDFLIPGDPGVTRAAFYSFTQELREGERFRDAAAVFCRQIIESDTLE